MNTPTTVSTQTVSPAGSNEWTAVLRNMTIAATGAPSVAFASGSGFPIYLDGSVTNALSAAVSAPQQYVTLSGQLDNTVALGVGTIIPINGSYRIQTSDGFSYDATLQYDKTAAAAYDLQIATLTPVDNAPAVTGALPHTLGNLAGGPPPVYTPNAIAPVTLNVNGTGIITDANVTVNPAALTEGAGSSNVVANVQNLGTVAAPAKTSLVTFNPDGTIASGAPSTIPPLTLTTGAKPFGGPTFTLNLGAANTAGGLTQFTDQFAVSFLNQDGVRFGFRTGVSFGADGLVSAVFDNGQQIPLFKVPLVNFANVNQLQAITGDVFGQTTDSGDPVPNFPGIGGTGQLTPSTLEQSTVDLSTEFANLIVTQRTFSADAKTITTADQMLQQLIEIKQ